MRVNNETTGKASKLAVSISPPNLIDLGIASVKYLLQDLFFLKDLIESILFLKRVLGSCVVGYSESPWFMFDSAVPSDSDEYFAPFRRTLIVSPDTSVDHATAEKVVGRCKEIAEEEAKKWDEIAPDLSAYLRYDARALTVWRLYHVIPIVRWLAIREKIKALRYDNRDFGKMFTDNWSLLEREVKQMLDRMQYSTAQEQL